LAFCLSKLKRKGTGKLSFKKDQPKNQASKDGGGRGKIRLLFTLGSLEGGGAERVIINLLKYLDRSKFELHLAVVHYYGPFIESVPGDVVLHDLKAGRVRKSFLPFIRLFRQLKPELIFSTLGYLNLAILLLKPFIPRTTKIFVRETSLVSENLQEVPFLWIWEWLYRLFYKKADCIICLCQTMVKDLTEHYNIEPGKMVCIYNPVDLAEIHILADQGLNPFSGNGQGPHILAAGRLGPEKGFDRLIRAFSSLINKKPTARLWIMGKGDREDSLKGLIRELNLQEKVFLTGFQTNPFLWFKHADLFVLSSRYEGLPNTLLEALACGCPVVALQHPGGTGEVLEILGLKERYVDSLDHWLEGWWERPSDGVAYSLEHHFGKNKIIREYENLLSRYAYVKPGV
jgi:glycosyltransferase involved in cell wall biosynthesis